MSEWYPSTRAPTSMITVSPSTIVRDVGSVVRAGGVFGTAGHDRVVARTVGAEAPHPMIELVADVRFARFVGEHRCDVAEGGRGDLGGELDAHQFGVVLHPAELLDHAAVGGEGDVG